MGFCSIFGSIHARQKHAQRKTLAGRGFQAFCARINLTSIPQFL
jgi:hypothetical protein